MFSELLPLRQKALGIVARCLLLLTVLYAFVFCLPFCLTASAELTELTIEQVRAQMPQLRVYCSGSSKDELEDAEVQAYLDGEALEYAGVYDGGQDGTDYIFLLDVSGSMKKADFEAAKEQILEFYKNLNNKDSLALVTFGDSVEIVFNGAAGNSDFEQKLNALSANDAQTHLYEAINSGVAYAQAQDVSRRQIMIVVSDGIQDTGSVGVTRTDVERELAQASLPLYSICTQGTSYSEQEKFSAFAHQTGGGFFTFQSSNAAQVWQRFADKLGEYSVLVFEGNSNLVDGKNHTLMLKYRSGSASESATRQVALTQWQPDRISPQVENVHYLADTGVLVLKFSEKVTGADRVSAYWLVSDGEEFAATNVAESGENTYTVTLPQELPTGRFMLKIVGVADNSMEKNQLDYKPISFEKPIDTHKLWLWAGVAISAVLLVLLIAVVLLRRKKVKEQVVTYRVEHINAPHLQQSVEPDCAPEDAAQLTIGLVNREHVEQMRTLRFSSSSIWGRGDEMCDLCIDDKKISHQHCVLELSGDAVMIRDLGSQNGTYLNGIRLTQPCSLKQGDTVQLGDTMIKILSLSFNFNEQDDCTIPL